MIKRVPFVAPAAGGGLEYDPIENSADNRAAYRHLLFSTPNLSDHVSGVILHEETLFQQSPELYEGQQQNFVSMLNSRGIVGWGGRAAAEIVVGHDKWCAYGQTVWAKEI